MHACMRRTCMHIYTYLKTYTHRSDAHMHTSLARLLAAARVLVSLCDFSGKLLIIIQCTSLCTYIRTSTLPMAQGAVHPQLCSCTYDDSRTCLGLLSLITQWLGHLPSTANSCVAKSRNAPCIPSLESCCLATAF